MPLPASITPRILADLEASGHEIIPTRDPEFSLVLNSVLDGMTLPFFVSRASVVAEAHDLISKLVQAVKDARAKG